MRLICSAWQEEVKHLSSTINDQHIAALGIGYLEAALRLNNILRDGNYSRIIFLGTAGAYSEELQIGEIVNISSVALLNPLTIQGKGYTPCATVIARSEATKQSIPNANCLSSLEITNCNKLSQEIIQYYNSNFVEHSAFDIQLPLVENMELYGVAKIASEQNIPWSALLGITNHTNANAHQDWKAHHERVSEKLCEAFLSTNTNL